MKIFKTHHLIWVLFLIVAGLSLAFSVVAENPPLTNSERVSSLHLILLALFAMVSRWLSQMSQ